MDVVEESEYTVPLACGLLGAEEPAGCSRSFNRHGGIAMASQDVLKISIVCSRCGGRPHQPSSFRGTLDSIPDIPCVGFRTHWAKTRNTIDENMVAE